MRVKVLATVNAERKGYHKSVLDPMSAIMDSDL